MNLEFELKGDSEKIEDLKAEIKSDLFKIVKADDSPTYYLIFNPFEENKERFKIVQKTLDRFVAHGIIPSLTTEIIPAGLGIGSSNIKSEMWPTIPSDLIASANLFANKCYDIENNKTDKVDHTILTEHRGYVLGAIFLSVTFLEATINNLFTEATYSNEKMKSLLKEEIIHNLKDKWTDENFKTRTGTLRKYQEALNIIQKQKFVMEKEPYKSVHKLILLRHELIHFKPNWLPFGDTRDSINNEQLKDLMNYFEPNKLLAPSFPLYPDQFLSCSCAKWAVKSCLIFTDEFFNRIGLKAYSL